MTTWRELIDEVRGGEAIVACTLGDAGLDREFDSEFGSVEGVPFTAWTATRVFFPICCDGSEWAGSAPRDPTVEALADPCEHRGGW